MITPLHGYTLIIEDRTDSLASHGKLKESGFVNPNEKNIGVTGVVYATSPYEWKCDQCGRMQNCAPVKEGDKVVFSKFVAEHLDDVKERLRSVPTDAILGIINDS